MALSSSVGECCGLSTRADCWDVGLSQLKVFISWPATALSVQESNCCFNSEKETFFFGDMVSLYSPGYPGTHSVDQAGLN